MLSMIKKLQRRRRTRFSVEFTVTGRNDDYEPNWGQRLEAVLAYNRALFEKSQVDFRVAFVEWNPPDERSVLADHLVHRFPFVRAILVDRKVHAELCEADDLVMMLNFSLNAALRTSTCDYMVISGGDVFIGEDVAWWFTHRGLEPRCLYRAERVDIRNDLDFNAPSADVLENFGNVIRINSCQQRPYNKPPFTNASGDFILMDRASFHRLRGFDESVRHARLHLDSRCCLSALALGLSSRLISHIYHINHSRSYVSRPDSYPGKKYDYAANIPYRNPDHWGLQDRTWKQLSERLSYVA